MADKLTFTDEQKEILRRTPIEEVLRSRGYDTSHTRSGLYHSPFRNDSTPSFHIDASGNRWSDPGDTDPRHIKRKKDGTLNKQAGGDVVDLVMWLDDCSFSEALAYLARINGIAPERVSVRSSADVAVNSDGSLSGYVNHSGGAIGADSYWGEVGAKYGVVSRHYWHGKKTPNGNTQVSEADFNEGVEKVKFANRRLQRNPDKYMDLLARNWMQVRESDAVFAVGGFAPSVIRLASGFGYRGVDGGTGWAAQMAIDSGKPLYLCDQSVTPAKWYRFVAPDKAGFGWRELDSAPVLTRDFAGIGTRQLNEAGRLAIREAYMATLRKVKEESVSVAAEPAPTASDSLSEPSTIDQFTGEYRFLSNFWSAKVVYEGMEYPSVENAYQAAKCADPADRARFVGISASEAKKLGRQVTMRSDWDSVKYAVMLELVRQKFALNRALAERLLATGDAMLVEGNTWRDVYWGVDLNTGEGENHLGEILMDVRRGLAVSMKATDGKDFMAGVDSDKVVKVSVATNENASLTNFAERPFVAAGREFRWVAQYYLWNKAMFAGDIATANRIISAGSALECSKFGADVSVPDVEGWMAKAASVMETGLRLSFISNTDDLNRLLSTGKSLITGDFGFGSSDVDVPSLLMKVRSQLASEIVDDNGTYHGSSTIKVLSFERGPKSQALKDYFMRDREISAAVLAKYAYEVTYQVVYEGTGEVSRPYTAVGFPNVNGFWALRGAPYKDRNGEMNKGVKRSTGHGFTAVDKDGKFMYVTEKGMKHSPLKKTAPSVVVFEGFTDFFSWLDWSGKVIPENADAVILNSVTNTPSALDYIVSHEKVLTYLDADAAGIARTKQIAEACKEANVSWYNLTQAFDMLGNDVNEAWVTELTNRRSLGQAAEQNRRNENVSKPKTSGPSLR